MKSGNLKFLETSEQLQACNGTALPYLCTEEYDNIKMVFKRTGMKILGRKSSEY